jgi:type IX secretion system PorP/SprF family membrane protein
MKYKNNIKKLFRSLIPLMLLIVITSLPREARAQQHAVNSMFNYNRLDFNPAVAGASDHIPITLHTRQQWIGFENAPRSQFISTHAFLPFDIGLGGVVYNNITGPTRQTGAKIAFSKHFNLTKNDWFSLGISAEFYENLFDVNQLETGVPNDPTIQTNIEQKLAPDASFGAFFYSANYFAGISATNLLQSTYDLLNTGIEFDNPIERIYFLTGGYHFKLPNDLAYQPSVLVKKTMGTPWQADISNKIIYKNIFWSGLSFRTNLDAILMLGVRYKIYELAYSYDFNFNEIKDYTHGSHEIILRFNLNNPIRQEGSFFQKKEGMFNW